MKRLLGFLRPKGPFGRQLLWVLLIAAVIRALGCFGQGMPFSYYPDERHSVQHALRFGATKSLDPGWFNKPTLGYYVLLVEYGVYYTVGRAVGIFDSPEDFGASFYASEEAFLLIGRFSNVLFALATIWMVALIGRRIGNRRTAILAALFLALIVGHVDGSQEVKMDVPAAFWSAAALLAMIIFVQRGTARHYLLAGFLGGLGIATKYYPVCLMAVFALAHLMRKRPARAVARRTWWSGRAWLGGSMFFVGFFVGSPYNFLSRQWYDERLRHQFEWMWKRLAAIGPGSTTTIQNAEPALEFENQLIGARTPVAESVLHNLLVLAGAHGAGLLIGALFLVGFAALLIRRTAERGVLLVAFLVPLVFLAFASQLRAEPRHLMMLYPPMALIAALGLQAGAHAVGRRLGAARRTVERRVILVGVLLCLVPAPGMPVWNVVAHAREQLQVDPRNEAREWIEANVPAGSTIINDNHRVFLLESEPRFDWARETLNGEIDRMRGRLDKIEDADARRGLERRIRGIESRLLEWRFRQKGAALAGRTAFDVIYFHHEWMNERLWLRDEAASFYNDLWPRSPLGWEVSSTVAYLKRTIPVNEFTTERVLIELAGRFDTRIREQVKAAMQAEGIDPNSPAGQAALPARVAAHYAGIGGMPPPPVELWRHATPVSERWLARSEDGSYREVEWFVSASKSHDNYQNRQKRQNFPDWALFYDDLKAHYDCWVFGEGDPDDARVVKLWDLRERKLEPKVTIVSRSPAR